MLELKPLTNLQLLGTAVLVGYALIEHWQYPVLAATFGYLLGTLADWVLAHLLQWCAGGYRDGAFDRSHTSRASKQKTKRNQFLG